MHGIDRDSRRRFRLAVFFPTNCWMPWPVHRVIQEARLDYRNCSWTMTADGFSETSQPLSTCAISEYFAAQQITLS